jgi:AmmeMemoRadiSam system protein A
VTAPIDRAPLLTPAQKREVLKLARGALEAQVRGVPPPAPSPAAFPPASGVFVTVKNGGELRGCLGTLESRDSLAGDVARCAADAASRDPRFAPVSAAELPRIAIEVSALGPLEPIDRFTPGAVVVGRHGLVVEQGPRRGLLLPQVATEWGWTAEEFLAQTCTKAGLPRDAWRHGARIYRFEADVFGEAPDARLPPESRSSTAD